MGNAKDKKVKTKALKNDFWMLGLIWRFTPSYVILCLIDGVFLGINSCIGMLFIKYLLNFLTNNSGLGKISNLVIAYGLYIAIFNMFFYWFYQVFLPYTKEKLHREMCSSMFLKAVSLDLEKYDDPEFYDDFIWAMEQTYIRATNLMDDTERMTSRMVGSVTLVGIFFGIDPLMAVLILAFAITRIIFTTLLNRTNVKFFSEINPLNRKDNYIRRVFMLPDYAKEIRATTVAEPLFDEFDKNKLKKDELVEKYSFKRVLFQFLGMALPVIGETLLYIILIYKIMVLKTMQLGDLTVAISGLWKISWNLRDLADRLIRYHEHGIFIEKIIKFMKNVPSIVGGEVDAPEFEELEIKDLEFSYTKDGQQITALDRINMKIRRGEKIAIVGYNGAGKTTLTKLIMRLYDPKQGTIKYNGKNLKEYSINSLRDKMVAVFQDYRIFAGTVAENVVGGEFDGKNEEKVLKALEKSDFCAKLKTLSNGILTLLTREFEDDGTELSGGEKQKLAIARAFYKNAQLIIMDEPSSALDPDAEYNLNRSISRYAEDKTVIFISHRLSTTRHADRIYMFEKGKIVESGTHEELIAKNGKYAYMFNLQAEKYRKAATEKQD